MKNGDKEKRTIGETLGQAVIVSAMLVNEALTPLSNFLNKREEKKERKERATWPRFDEEELNEWYHFFKERGDYPEYLEQKYQEKYPRLRDIFLGNVTLEEANKPNPSRPHARNSNTLFSPPLTQEKTDNEHVKTEQHKQGL